MSFEQLVFVALTIIAIQIWCAFSYLTYQIDELKKELKK